MKKIMSEKERIVFSQERRLENNQDRNWENKSFIKKHSYEQHHRIKGSHRCRSKIRLWKNRISLEEREERIQTWMGN